MSNPSNEIRIIDEALSFPSLPSAARVWLIERKAKLKGFLADPKNSEDMLVEQMARAMAESVRDEKWTHYLKPARAALAVARKHLT